MKSSKQHYKIQIVREHVPGNFTKLKDYVVLKEVPPFRPFDPPTNVFYIRVCSSSVICGYLWVTGRINEEGKVSIINEYGPCEKLELEYQTTKL